MKKIIVMIMMLVCVMGLTACGGNDGSGGKYSKYKKLEKGDTCQFGTYENEPITWIVLENDNGKLLLITEDVLEPMEYHDEKGSITWELCSLRKWLNGEFFDSSFTEKEKDMIIKTEVRNDDNKEFDIDGGNDTKDNVFILSADEAAKYFSSDEERNVNNGKNSSYRWWLRSPGYHENCALLVLDDGTIANTGLPANTVEGEGGRICAVRPVIWIDTN